MTSDWLQRRQQKRKESGAGSKSVSPARPMSTWAQITQALISGVTLATAIFAFTSWKSQETGKRRAEIASSMMIQVHRLSTCLQSSPLRLGWPGIGDDLALQLAIQSLGVMQKCEQWTSEMKVNAAFAKSALDHETARSIVELNEMLAKRHRNLARLQALAGSEKPTDEITKAKRNEQINAILEELSLTSADSEFLLPIFKSMRIGIWTQMTPKNIEDQTEIVAANLSRFLRFER